MIYVFVAFGLALVLFFMFLTMVLLFSRPPTWYEDMPPKNWNSEELTQDEVTRAIEENERRWNASVDDE